MLDPIVPVVDKKTAEKERREADAALEEASKLPRLSPQHQVFVYNFFDPDVEYNATEAYARTFTKASRETARRNGSALLKRTDIQAHIRAMFAERQMTADEAIDRLTQQARGNLAIFYKKVEQWMFDPLPHFEILEEREVPDGRRGRPAGSVRTEYKVRRVVLDIDKITDPRYAHLIREFSANPRTGISIKLHDPQRASDQILRTQGAYKDKIALTDPDGNPLPNDNGQYDRAISTLASALGEILSRQSAAPEGSMDTPE